MEFPSNGRSTECPKVMMVKPSDLSIPGHANGRQIIFLIEQQKEGQYFALLGISLVDQQDASEFCQLLLFQTLEDPILKCVEMVDPTFTHGTPQECTVGSQQAGEPPTCNYFKCLRVTGKRMYTDPSSANDSIVERK